MFIQDPLQGTRLALPGQSGDEVSQALVPRTFRPTPPSTARKGITHLINTAYAPSLRNGSGSRSW